MRCCVRSVAGDSAASRVVLSSFFQSFCRCTWPPGTESRVRRVVGRGGEDARPGTRCRVRGEARGGGQGRGGDADLVGVGCAVCGVCGVLSFSLSFSSDLGSNSNPTKLVYSVCVAPLILPAPSALCPSATLMPLGQRAD
jgi:hypothetical protein